MTSYDYVIVGAGSAGCVLANRLSADPSKSVLLLEAGPSDWSPLIHMPAGLAKLVRKNGLNWNYRTEPEPALNQRRLWWPRGKTLGGSSSINAMCYIRGQAADYDHWAAVSSDPRWSWEQVLPWFLHSEDNSRGASALHGVGGPLGVSDLRHHNELSATMIKAAATAGYPVNDDFNGEQQDGFGLYQVTQRDGARCSTATAYLTPARERENLHVRTRVLVHRVLLDQGRAVGIEIRQGRAGSERIEAGEVILAAGTINTPQLLMLSGLGPADHLRDYGLPVFADLPDVGGNLQDHLDICTVDGTDRKVTYDHINELAVGLRWLRHRDGPGSSNVAEAGGFVRSELAEDERCDFQFHFCPVQLEDHGHVKLPGYGYTMHACFLHPRSRGYLRLQSVNPAQPIAIHARYLSDPEGYDLKRMIAAARVSRDILDQPAFNAYRSKPVFPESAIRTDAEYTDFIRRKAQTIYHPVGTCRMGTDDRAVVDSELRVRGIQNLRIVDASVMPTLPTGNTNAPTIMIAERASALILGKSQNP